MKNKLLFFLLFLSGIVASQVKDTIISDSIHQKIMMNEVSINISRNKAGKYNLILPKKILENETLDKTIRRTTFITIDNTKSIYFKGKKIGNVLLNEKLISIEEFNKLTIENVKNIQIDTGYFNQSTGEIETVLKVTEKKNTFNNIKGSLDFSQGFFQKFNYYGLSLNSKVNRFSSRLMISNIINTTDNETSQQLNNAKLYSNNQRELKQPYYMLQNIYEINDKSSIYVRNKYSEVNENVLSEFSDLNSSKYKFLIKSYSLNIRYDKQFEKRLLFRINLDYLDTRNQIYTSIPEKEIVAGSSQKFNEYTFSPYLQKKWNNSEINNSVVITYRDYRFNNTSDNNYIRQNIITTFSNYAVSINTNSSLSLGARYQYDNNNKTQKDYHFLLPSITYLTRFDSIADVEFNFKRTIKRPSIRSISGAIYTDQNGNEILNQNFIRPEINNEISFDITKNFKKLNFNLNLSYNHSTNHIATIYNFNTDNVLYSTLNIDKYIEKTIRPSISVSLWNDSRLNINYALSQVIQKNDGLQHKGIVNSFDLSLSGPVWTDYLFSFNTFYVDRFYDFNAKTKSKIDGTFSVSKNFINNKLNVSLEFRNILNMDANRTLSFSENHNSYILNNINQSSLLLVSLTYNFGKEFKTVRKTIQNTNNDMKP